MFGVLTAFFAGALIFIFLAVKLYFHVRDINVAIVAVLLFYFSLGGAIQVILTNSGLVFLPAVDNLARALYPIDINGDYVLTLIFYSLFIIICLFAFRVGKTGGRSSLLKQVFPIDRHFDISFVRLIILSSITLAVLALYLNRLSDIGFISTSVYLLRNDSTLIATSSQNMLYYLRSIAYLPPFIGLGVWLSRNNPRFFKISKSRLTPIILLVDAIVITFLAILLGSKSMLLDSFLVFVGVYSMNDSRPKARYILVLLIATISLGGFIDIVRGVPTSTISKKYDNLPIREPVIKGLSSGEMLAAHTSLYASINKPIEQRWGWSILSLVCSVVPLQVWPDRPENIYYYYANNIGLPWNQGFTIHHATAWFLNLSYPGIILGALIFGRLWRCLFFGYRRLQPNRYVRLAYMAFYLGFVVSSYQLMRTGPEGYKSVLLNCLVLTAIFFVAISPKISRLASARTMQFVERGYTRERPGPKSAF